MIALLFYILAAWGFWYTIGRAAITDGIREWLVGQDPADPVPLLVRRTFVHLIECPACSGFWIGFFSAWCAWTPFEANAFAWGFFTLATTYLITKLADFFGNY